MWVAVGPFDGEVNGDSGFLSTLSQPKLLKANSSYIVGRKDRPLLVNNKKISHDHCEFVVGLHTTEDARDPRQKPTLELINHNKKDKSLTILRNGRDVHAFPSSKQALEDGDVVSLITGVTVTVKWEYVCVFASIPNQCSLEDCATLGIKLLRTPRAETTHHIVAEYTPDLRSCASLLSLCQFVKPDWLQEVVRLGKLPRKDHLNTVPSLEDHFILPSESKYQPTFSVLLEPSFKKLSVWQPNEERVNLFRNYRFICLQEKVSTADTDLRDALQFGGGSMEAFDIHSGVQKFRRALTRGKAKEGKQTIIVGDSEAMQAAIGVEAWNELSSEAQSCALAIHSHSDIIQAVLKTECESLTSKISSSQSTSSNISSRPSVVPDFLPQEPAPQPRQTSQSSDRPRLTRRVPSRASSLEPSTTPPAPMDVNPVADAPPPPRKALTRRVRATKQIITGIDDPSSVIDAVPDLTNVRKTPPPQVVDLTAPTPARSTKLKRRLGMAKESTQTALSGIPETVREPPLKKFKALFESTNPDGTGLESQMGDFVSGDHGTQTQDMETQAPVAQTARSMGASTLAVLREEEEESQLNMPVDSLPRVSKRRLSSEDDVALQVIEDSRASTAEPVNKKRAIENVNAVEPVVGSSSQTGPLQTFVKPSSTSVANHKSGGIPGEPDKDAAFLMAIASTKRGKKHEDDFDREFNKLKISKPELDQPDPEEEWNILADFGDDSGLRGNFMVIMEMDVYRKDSAAPKKSLNSVWEGKPNFKKFKKKFIPSRHHAIDLVVSEENDYGMGPNYWKSGRAQTESQTQTQAQVDESQSQESIPPLKKRGAKRQPIPEVNDEDEETLPSRPKRSSSRRPPSRASSAAPDTSTAKRAGKAKAPAKASALFLDSDDDIQEVLEPPEDNHMEHRSEETLKSSPEEKKPPSRRTTRTATTRKPASRAKKAPVIVVDDDSDDDAVFKGFKAKAGR